MSDLDNDTSINKSMDWKTITSNRSACALMAMTTMAKWLTANIHWDMVDHKATVPTYIKTDMKWNSNEMKCL